MHRANSTRSRGKRETLPNSVGNYVLWSCCIQFTFLSTFSPVDGLRGMPFEISVDYDPTGVIGLL